MNRFPLFSSRVISLMLCVLLLASFGIAQTSRGTVTGTVTDSSGAVVPNAAVTLTSVDTNQVRETQANSAGIYRFDAVNLGVYTVKVSMAGFAPQEVKGLEVKANQNSTVDFALKVGKTSETVEVAAANTQVALQTEEQLRGGSLGTTSLESLPISGQNSLSLMTTVAGIIPSNNGVADSGVGSVNGSRARANNFMIDGVDNNDISVAGPAITMTNNDAIQEVSIQTANFSAEFGRSGGAIVNQVTKSGTNKLHGTGAWVYRSQRFDAATVNQGISHQGQIAKGNTTHALKGAYKDNIPAFTVGGPVIIPGLYDGRNKTFWFAAGQYEHYGAGASVYAFNVPTAAGIDTLKALAATGKCPNAALYVNALSGLTAANKLGTINLAVPAGVGTTCNGTDRAGMVVDYGQGYRSIVDDERFWNQVYRIDHTFSPKHNLSVRAFLDHGKAPGGVGIARPFDADYAEESQSIAISETAVLSNTMTNELRANFTHIAVTWPVIDESGLGALPLFNISSLSAFGTSTNYPQGRTPNTYQLSDALTKVWGRHQIRVGGDLFRQIAVQIAPMNIRGTLNYASSGTGATLVTGLSNFVDDWSGSGTGRVTRSYGSNRYHPSYWNGSWFAQDNFKLRSGLSINYGIRWDYFGQPANNFKYPVVNLDPAGYSTQKLEAAKNMFGPSVGFAWSPKFLGDKSVIRGGFQLSYDRFYNNLLSNMAAGTPNVASNVPVNAPATGRGVAALYATEFAKMTANSVATTLDASSQFTPDITNPYTYRWSLGVQRELPGSVILDASYVGSASHHLFQQVQLNPFGTPVLQTGSTYLYTSGPRLNSAIGGRIARGSGANSNYNGLQVEAKRSLANTPLGKVQFTAAYTWSHSLSVIDEVFATYSSNATMMTANPLLYDGNRHWDYGNSDNDRRHRLVSTLVWDVRGPKKGLLYQALGGWSFGAVLPIQSATPFTVFNGADRDLDGSAADRPNIANSDAPLNTMAQWVPTATCFTNWQSVNNRECVTPANVHWLYYPTGVYNKTNTGTARRNSLYTKTGSITMNLDARKNFRITEGIKLEYRAEIFNLFNHRNYNLVPLNTTLKTIFDSVDKNTLQPTTTFLDYTQQDTGNRTMRMGLKLTF